MESRIRRYEAVFAALVPLLLFASGLVWLARSGQDVSITDRFFDRTTGTWPLADGFWIRRVMHVRARDFIFIVGFTALMIAVSTLFTPRLLRFRRQALYVVLAIAVSTGVVALLKSQSPVPSPWDSIRYGGQIPHLSPFATYPSGVPLGKCFPGAHAAGAFALMSFYYVFREVRLRCAWIAMGAGAFIGCVYGAVQVARGAHYWSHNLWSAAIVWTICTLLYWLVFRGRLTRAEASRSARQPIQSPDVSPSTEVAYRSPLS